MIEKALYGSKKYYGLLAVLSAIAGIGTLAYFVQFFEGLGVTGLSRDVSWGLYIAQLTFLVGVAASGVMVVLPYYLHNYKEFGKITILGEFLAIGAILMCMTFVFVDMGRPDRITNVFLHPTPNSVMFWDVVVLFGYLGINLLVGFTVLAAERKAIPPPKWIKPFIYLSIPWAVSIHTVTAFLYSGLPGRHMWLSAILAARFLASAFCAGPALLIILILIVRRTTKFEISWESVQKLAQIVTYAMIMNIFFLCLELFTAFYSGIPGHSHSFVYIFFGLEGHSALVPWMWLSMLLAVIAIGLLIFPQTRRVENTLAIACVAVFISTWIDKGMGLVVGGFIPSPLEHVTEYMPTLLEVLITLGIWAIGFLVITVLFKIAITVKEETAL